jgi:hypothetical protein
MEHIAILAELQKLVQSFEAADLAMVGIERRSIDESSVRAAVDARNAMLGGLARLDTLIVDIREAEYDAGVAPIIGKVTVDVVAAVEQLDAIRDGIEMIRAATCGLEELAAGTEPYDACKAAECGHYTCTEGGALGYWEGADPSLPGNF